MIICVIFAIFSTNDKYQPIFDKISYMECHICKKLASNIGSRKKAIKTAIKELESNEILLVAGKGHEEYQEVNNEKIPFGDKDVVNSFKNSP